MIAKTNRGRSWQPWQVVDSRRDILPRFAKRSSWHLRWPLAGDAFGFLRQPIVTPFGAPGQRYSCSRAAYQPLADARAGAGVLDVPVRPWKKSGG